MNPYEPESLSFTITDPWRPVVQRPRSGHVARRRSWSWKIPAVCGGTFVLGMLAMVVLGVLEAPPTATIARMPAVVASPPPPPPVIEIVSAPPAPPPPPAPKPVRRASPAPKRPRVVAATPGLFDSPD